MINPDYRKLNKVPVFDPESMTSPEALIASMKTTRYFTKLDLCKGYWQVPMNEKDIPKTALLLKNDAVRIS